MVLGIELLLVGGGLPIAAPTGHSLLFTVGCRMMAYGRRGVSIAMAALPMVAGRLRALNEISSPILPTGSIGPALSDGIG